MRYLRALALAVVATQSAALRPLLPIDAVPAIIDAFRPHAVPNEPPEWYSGGMRTTIDKAGRLVIPAVLRERMGLTAGSEVELTEDDLGIHLTRVAAGPRLVKIGPRLVARPTAPVESRPAIDVAALVEDERNRWP